MGSDVRAVTTFRVPDSVVPVEGYRAWRVTRAGALVSVAGSTTWTAERPILAECEWGGHAAPAFDCTCGLYAFARLDHAVDITRWYRDVIIGRVALWGTVVEHERGWRASCGAVRELFVCPWPTPRLASEAAALIGRDLADAVADGSVLFVGGPEAGIRPRPTGDTWVSRVDGFHTEPFPPTDREALDDLDPGYWANVETDLFHGPTYWCYRFDGRMFRLAAVVDHPSDWEVEEPSADRPTGAGPTRR